MVEPRCLIIDRSIMVRRVAARIIRELGFEITDVDTGREALDLCEAERPDVVLFEWRLDDMSGAALIAGVLDTVAPGETPPKLIVCTADRSVETITAALSAGADEYVIKPFDSDIIESKFALVGLYRRAPKAA